MNKSQPPKMREWVKAQDHEFATEMIGSQYWDLFCEFADDNPRVYELFFQFTIEATNQKRMHFGARFVWERMRWFVNFETKDPYWFDFKLNSNYIAFYSRIFMLANPLYLSFFRTRRMR